MIALLFGSMLKRLTDGLLALLGIARRYPWQCACIVLCALLAWQIHGKQAASRQRDQCQAGRKADRQAYIDAEAEASAKAIAALKAQEARYTTLAKEADHAHSTDMVAANAAAADYIRTHRVPIAIVGRSPGETTAASQGSGPGVHAGATADAELVAISADDINACTGAATYAMSAYDWSRSLAGE